jgi:hypothetical protein
MVVGLSGSFDRQHILIVDQSGSVTGQLQLASRVWVNVEYLCGLFECHCRGDWPAGQYLLDSSNRNPAGILFGQHGHGFLVNLTGSRIPNLSARSAAGPLRWITTDTPFRSLRTLATAPVAPKSASKSLRHLLEQNAPQRRTGRNKLRQ